MRKVSWIAVASVTCVAALLAPRAAAGSLPPEADLRPEPIVPPPTAWVDVAPRPDASWLAPPSSPTSAALCGGAGGCAPPCPRPSCEPDPCRWRFSFTLPVWVPNVTGTFASGSTTIDTGGRLGSLSDVLSDLVPDPSTSLDFAFVGRFVAQKGPWTLQADGYYASLGSSIDWKVRDEDADGSLDAAILRAFAVWQERSPLGRGACSPILGVGPLVGARAYSIDLHVDPATGSNIDRSKSWIDPIVGLKADVTWHNGASVALVADVGGVITGSDPSWSLDLELSWPLGRHWAVIVGWTVLDVDYDVGSGDSEFRMNVNLTGPHLGVTYLF